MDRKLWQLLFVAVATIGLFMLGCASSDSTDNNGTSGPGAAILNTPANGATNVSNSPTLFRWSTAARAVGYRLQVSSDSQFGTMVINHDAAMDTTYSTTALSYGMPYYWRVETRDSSGLLTLSGHFTFSTIGALFDMWDARANWRDSLGVDQMRYTFSTDSSYSWFYSFGATSITRSGTFSTTPTVMTFHETNNDGTPVDTMYSRDWALSGDNSTLTLEWRDGSTAYDIQYDRVP